MAVDIVFTEAKKGYNKEEVQRFIERLTSDHQRAIREKEDAVKSLMNEKEGLEAKYADRIAELEAELEKAQTEGKEQSAKYDELCARMGEKLLFAEQQSANIIVEAEEARENARREAEVIRSKAAEEAAQKAELSVAAISAKARENAASALRAADILKQKSQQICVGLDHTKRVLEEALEAIERATKND